MAADILKEFLVSLGWKIDQGSQKKAEGLIKSTTEKAEALGKAMVVSAASITASATVIVAAVTKIADSMEKLYFASQRTQASVANIQAIGFAAGQMGSSAGAALESLENLARFMRTSPGGEGLIRSLGVQTRDATGQMRDRAEVLQDLGKRFAQMPFYRANAYAQVFGIDEKTLIALRQGVGQFGAEYKQMLRAAGFDSDKAAKSSHLFMNEVRTLGAAFKILGQEAGTALTDKFASVIQRFRVWLVGHFRQITEVITKLADGLMLIIDDISRVIDWFTNLDASGWRLVKTFAAIGAAIAGLGALFLANPLTLAIAGITAALATLFLLMDDYAAYRRGGKHLIDWDNPGIQSFIKSVTDLVAAGERLYHLFADKITIKFDTTNLVGVIDVIRNVLSGNWGAAWEAAKGLKQGVETLPAGASRGIRNNNPGNLNYVGQPGATREGGSNGRFAAFGSAQQGLNALASQLRRYSSRGIDTLSKIVNKYAPAGDGNNTGAYVDALSTMMGVGSNEKLNLNDPRVMEDMMRAIVVHENGSNPYSREMFDRAAGVKTAGGSQGVTINQTNTTHVTGSSDPQGAGRAVEQAQNRTNERLIRNMRAFAH